MNRVAQQLLSVVVLASLASALASCGRPSELRTGEETTMDEDSAYVFVNRSDAQFEQHFILRGRSCFAQVSLAPLKRQMGQKRKFYLCTSLTDNAWAEARKWLEASGDIEPPFEPDAGHFSRVVVDLAGRQSDGGIVWFDMLNADIEDWLDGLARVVMVEEYRIEVEAIPDWISESDILLEQLGFHDEYDPFPHK